VKFSVCHGNLMVVCGLATFRVKVSFWFILNHVTYVFKLIPLCIDLCTFCNNSIRLHTHLCKGKSLF
jgi:hypothetical protein